MTKNERIHFAILLEDGVQFIVCRAVGKIKKVKHAVRSRDGTSRHGCAGAEALVWEARRDADS